MKLSLRDGTDTNLFTPLGGSHRPFLTQARMFCVSDKAGSEGNLHLSWHSEAVTREIWRSYKLILKKRQQNWLHSHVARQFPSRSQQRQKFENGSISLPDTVHAHHAAAAAAASIPVTSHEHSKSHCLASNSTRDISSWLHTTISRFVAKEPFTLKGLLLC